MNMTRNTLDKVLGWIYLLASSVSYRRVILHWKNSGREVVREVVLNKMVYGTIRGHQSQIVVTQSTNYSFPYSVAKRCFSLLIQFRWQVTWEETKHCRESNKDSIGRHCFMMWILTAVAVQNVRKSVLPGNTEYRWFLYQSWKNRLRG